MNIHYVPDSLILPLMSARGAGPAHIEPTTSIFRLRIGSFKYDVLGLALRTGDRVIEFIVVFRKIILIPEIRR